MSAGTHAYINCDHLDKSAPPGRRGCAERIEEGQTRAEVRRIAKARGWLTGVHMDGSPGTRDFRGLWDYCPAHKPAPREG